MKILLIENNPDDVRLVNEMLGLAKIGPHDLVHEAKLTKALARLKDEKYDVILLDLPTPVGQSLDDVERICSACANAPVIVLTRHEDEEAAIQVMKRGAQDYLRKDTLSPQELSRVLRYCVERKRVFEEQSELFSRYRSLTHAASDAILSANHKGIITLWNSAATKIFGYKDADAIGKPLSVLIPERYHATLVSEMRRYHSRNVLPSAVRNVVMQALRADGAEFPIELSVGAWRQAGDICFTGIIRDITERKMAELSLTQSRDELSALSRRLLAVQEEERARISLQVHDQLGQSLTALKIDLNWIERRLLPRKQAELVEKTREMAALVEKTILEVREIATDLRPGLLDHFGLAAAIEWLFKEFTERTGVVCKLTVSPVDLGMHRDDNTLLFRVVQEAMTNVARHAEATMLKISLSHYNGDLKLDVLDNGKGITAPANGDKLFKVKSLGLVGVRERVMSVGGSMTVGPGPEGGTLLSVKIPRENKRAADNAAEVKHS